MKFVLLFLLSATLVLAVNSTVFDVEEEYQAPFGVAETGFLEDAPPVVRQKRQYGNYGGGGRGFGGGGYGGGHRGGYGGGGYGGGGGRGGYGGGRGGYGGGVGYGNYGGGRGGYGK